MTEPLSYNFLKCDQFDRICGILMAQGTLMNNVPVSDNYNKLMHKLFYFLGNFWSHVQFSCTEYILFIPYIPPWNDLFCDNYGKFFDLHLGSTNTVELNAHLIHNDDTFEFQDKFLLDVLLLYNFCISVSSRILSN
jgi:hypothetical protein